MIKEKEYAGSRGRRGKAIPREQEGKEALRFKL